MVDKKSSREVKETATVVLTRFVEGFEFGGKEGLQDILREQSPGENEADIISRFKEG